MRLVFRLRFHTWYGQSLFLTGKEALLGGDIFEQAIPLQYLDSDYWQATINLPATAIPASLVEYRYVLREADGSLTYDSGAGRKLDLTRSELEETLVIDTWNPAGLVQNTFYTEPFKQVLLRQNHTEVPVVSPERATHLFQVGAPLLGKGETLCLLGSGPTLGRWDTTRPTWLNRSAGQECMSAALDLSRDPFPIEYKYGVFNVETHSFVRYEDGPNRVLRAEAGAGRQVILNDGFAALPADTWKGAGVAIPVFSLRTQAGFGVGEFSDLKLLADWCRQAGLKLIQILPVNDTTATNTWTDSYPYAAISAFALHPQYLRLSEVATGPRLAWLEDLEPERRRLNALEAVDYEAVLKAKLAFLKEIYPAEREAVFRSKSYREFFERNRSWLVPYAVFCYWRDQNGTADSSQWGTAGTYDAAAAARLGAEGSPVYDEVAFSYFVQFHLHRQLEAATQYAHAQGVVLKGDIPIGVYRHGADAWQNPELYRLEMQAGAPPDAFTVKGQNWGFPTYNWPQMKQTGFAWWKRRFAQMGHYFDAFRIDHILGFFRIWSVPLHAVEGILGYFVPALPVRPAEFTRRGIAFDRDRYLLPWITDDLLREFFDAQAEEVAREFLLRGSPGRYALKPEFATQRQVERHLAALPATAANQALKRGLFDLISNVILLPEAGAAGESYHFRFAMDQTSSFRDLPAPIQSGLRDLYTDYFFHRQEDFWMREGMQKLPALKRVTNMLICGEDLGLVPHCVPEAMKQLGLLGLEVQRMPKRLGQEFSRPQDAPYLSVVTPSTHDMSTIRGWWLEDRKTTQKFFHQELGQAGEAPATCEPWINEAIVVQHLASPAMWSIFQLQDLLGLDGKLRRENPEEERINVPANPRNYWRYRMHLPLESLISAQGFNDHLRALLRANGR